jgi:hypothetical protein
MDRAVTVGVFGRVAGWQGLSAAATPVPGASHRVAEDGNTSLPTASASAIRLESLRISRNSVIGPPGFRELIG